MDLLNYLLNAYGYNEPFFTQEISFKEYSQPWIYKELNKLCEEGKLIRYDKGIYYIPKDTPLGKSVLDPRKIITKEYLQNGEEVVGYYSGNTLLNLLNISAQMPNTVEIYTNNEKSKIREVKIGKQRVVLRRARTLITKENSAVLQFLELMNFADAAFLTEGRKEKIRAFIEKNKITRAKLAEYAPVFPDKAMRNLIESGVIYSVAR